jgi:hypothetical protein
MEDRVWSAAPASPNPSAGPELAPIVRKYYSFKTLARFSLTESRLGEMARVLLETVHII